MWIDTVLYWERTLIFVSNNLLVYSVPAAGFPFVLGILTFINA